MSKLTTTRSTGKSFGFPSQKQLDIWSSQGMRKASVFSRRQHRTINQLQNSKVSIENEQELAFAFNSSLNQLRQKTRTQKSNQSTLSNRMSYMEVDLKRKKQMMQLAKNKYNKVIEVRHKSFVEKKKLTKEKQQMQKQYHKTVTLKVSQVRAERKNSTISIQNAREKNQTDASKIKKQRFINQRIVAERKQRDINKKRVIVENSQKYADLSKQKIKSFEESRFKQAKAEHNFKMLQEYLRGQMQKRKNTKLLLNFKSQVRRLEEQNNQVIKELSEYEKMLGWNYSNRGGNKQQTAGSFYLTH